MIALRDSPLLEFKIPSAFVLRNVLPTREELVYGYFDGWLSRQDVVAIVEARHDGGVAQSVTEESLLMLLQAEVDQVPKLLRDLEAECDPSEQPAHTWMFLALAWLLECSESVADPFAVIEMLVVDFGCPPELHCLLPYAPVAPGEPVGYDSMRAKWREYVRRVGPELRARVPR